jgi:hypothetical protein
MKAQSVQAPPGGDFTKLAEEQVSMRDLDIPVILLEIRGASDIL